MLDALIPNSRDTAGSAEFANVLSDTLEEPGRDGPDNVDVDNDDDDGFVLYDPLLVTALLGTDEKYALKQDFVFQAETHANGRDAISKTPMGSLDDTTSDNVAVTPHLVIILGVYDRRGGI